MPSHWCTLVLLLTALLVGLLWRWHTLSAPRSAAITTRLQRLLKPRTPDDCPLCCLQAALPPHTTSLRPSITPWRELKTRRGAPKRIATQGFACTNRSCIYYRIIDAQIHALVGDGLEGRHERIQTFRCQACGTTCSARRHTPLYRLKTVSHRVAQVLAAVADGLDVSAAARVFGHRPATITTWLSRAGEHSTRLHDCVFRNLYLPHIQFDELRTRLRKRAHVQWLWVALDPLTKIIPVLKLGARTQDLAHATVHELRERLVMDCIPLCTSDGLNQYFYALTAHFGQWVAGTGRRGLQWRVAAGLIYGQVKKRYRRRKLARVSQLMRCGTRDRLHEVLTGLGLSGRLNTAFVERVNLTLRQSIAALTRRTWSTMQDAPHLWLQLEWWRAYYHFVRAHESLRVALQQPVDRGGKRLPRRYRHRTPAMAAGLTSRCWTVADLLTLPLPSAPIAAG